MAISVVAGARTNANTSAQNIKVRDVESKINLLKPYKTPLQDFFASKFMGEKETRGEKSKHEWNEDAYLPDTVTATSGITGGGTTETIPVSSDYFLPYDTVLVESSGDMLLVTSISTGNIIVKKVGAGNITAASANVNIQRLSPAFAETGLKQTALSTITTAKSCYCQIIKKAVSLSGREQAANTYGDGWKYQWIKAGLEVKEANERVWLMNGASYNDTALDITYSAGMRGIFTTNYVEYNGSIDEVELDDFLTQIVNNGNSDEASGTLVLMAGGLAINDIHKFMKSRYSIMQDSKQLEIATYGLATAEKSARPHFIDYIHPLAGILRVVWNPQLKGSKWGASAVCFDPAMLTRMYMGSDEDGVRKYRTEEAIKTPGQDVKEGQMLFDQGLRIKLEQTGGWFAKKGL